MSQPLRCVIVEDQLPAQKVLQRYIADLAELELLATFTNALDAMGFLKEEQVDLLFLDIHLPKLSGLDFLKAMPKRPKVILTTAYTEYAMEGYELDVVDYLLKPISLERFIRAVTKVTELHQQPEPASSGGAKAGSPAVNDERYVFVKDGRDIVKIFFDEVLFIKASGDFVQVITTSKKYMIAYTMKYWEELLSNRHFYRVHKSFIINLQKVDRIAGNQVFIQDEVVPIGRSHRDAFLKKLNVSY